MAKVRLYFKPIEVDTDDTDEQIYTNFDINRYSYLHGVWDLVLDHIDREKTEDNSFKCPKCNNKLRENGNCDGCGWCQEHCVCKPIEENVK